MVEFRSLIRNSRSCRQFAEEPVRKDLLMGLIDDAVWVPSGSDNQPWRFVVITDREVMKKYSDAAKRDWLLKLDDIPRMLQCEECITDPDYNIFYNAPALVLIYGNSNSCWYAHDCGMVAYNLHLLAEEAGMGACWTGFASNIFSSEKVKAELGIPEEYELVAPVVMGYPARGVTASEMPRKPFVTQMFSIVEID